MKIIKPTMATVILLMLSVCCKDQKDFESEEGFLEVQGGKILPKPDARFEIHRNKKRGAPDNA